MRINKIRIDFLKFVIIFSINIFGCNRDETPEVMESLNEEIIKGIDASFIPELRKLNVKCFDKDSFEIDFLDLIKESGLNTVRFRIWHTPSSQHSSFEEVKSFSGEIKSKNLRSYLNFHYSDTWADPGHQSTPSIWTQLSFEQLEDSVYNYTRKVMEEIRPDFVQLGNEVNNGMLFPFGSINTLSQFKGLLQQAIRAVREVSPETRIIIHYAGFKMASQFYGRISDLDYDIIALSYYPFWHGKALDELNIELNELSTRFEKKIIIAEIAYPFDSLNGTEDFLVNYYPSTIDGQSDFIKKVYSFLEDTPTGFGLCLWGGVTEAYKIPKPTSNGYYWENQAVLDYSNNVLPVLEALNE